MNLDFDIYGSKNDVDNVVPSADRPRSYKDEYMKRGRIAEKMVWKFLEQSPYVIGINDFRELKPFQSVDVDFGIEKTDGTVKLAEVKSDSHLGKTDNILVEVARINHTSPPENCFTLGWTVRTPAYYIIYYAYTFHTLYICETSKLRKAFQKYTKKFRRYSNYLYVETDNIKSTINFLVPMSYCEGIFTIKQLPPEWKNE